MSNAGACRMYHIVDGERHIDAKRFEQMQEGRDFFFKFFQADCDRIAIENPTPLTICELPEPTQVIQPYDFGHKYSKRTCLWLKGLPCLVPTKYEMEWKPYLPSSTSRNAGKPKNKGTMH